MKGELLAADAQAWRTFLASTRHDVYHEPKYVALDARREAGEPVAVHIENGSRSMLLPLILRPIPGGGRDAVSPYGYPGPLVRETGDHAFLQDAMHEAQRLLAGHGVVSLFVRLHPLLNVEPPRGAWTIVNHGDTVGVDLSLPTHEHWHQTRGNHRVQINRAERKGQEVRFDGSWSRYEEFKRLYHETMARLSADAFYRFDDAYFDGLREALGSRLHLVTVETDGEVAAAGLFTEFSGIVQFHLCGSDDRFLRTGPTKLLLHRVRGWARERRDRWLHLGGGLGAASDSLLHFKLGFSPLRFPFHTLRSVLLEQEYRRLTASINGDVDPNDLAAFFPAYRRVTPRSG